MKRSTLTPYKNTCKKLIFAIYIVSVAALLSLSAHAERGAMNINIASQPVDTALLQLAKDAGVQIMFSPELTGGITAPAVSGNLTVEQAMDKLLSGTHLAYEFKGDDVIVVNKKAEDAGAVQSKTNRVINEIVVTATKRETSIQDTAMSITAVGSEEIARRGLVGMGDYLSSVPGVMSVLGEVAGRTAIAMRGIAANVQQEGGHGAMVGVYLGEVPVTGLGSWGNHTDVKLADIQRIEVLRGPQGTLYGSSNMGGTVRNIPMPPNLSEFEGNFKAGYSNTAKFGSGNSEFQGVINIPLIEDKLAVRAVGYRYDNSGFYRSVGADDPNIAAAVATWGAVAREKGEVGSDEYSGGRISALWQPNEKLSVNVSYLHQTLDVDGVPAADLVLGEGEFLQRRMKFRHLTGEPDFSTNDFNEDFTEPAFDEEFRDELDIANATIEYDLGWATILSSSSWLEEKSKVYNELGQRYLGFKPASELSDFNNEAFIQEVRLASQFNGPFQFVGGLYYEDIDRSRTGGILFGGDAVNSPFGGEIKLSRNIEYAPIEQKAAFGEVSYDLTDQIKLTAGARAFTYNKKSTYVYKQAFFDPAPVDPSEVEGISGDESDINYKTGIDYSPNENTLLYASWSQGFRLGLPVPAASPALKALCDQDGDGFYDGSNGVTTGARQIDSDYVDNYELGGKFTLLDHRLQISADIYQINWEGIPLHVNFGVCGATLNAGKARSRGGEFEGAYVFGNGLSINAGASYVDAELTEDAPSLGSAAGDALPGSPKYSFNVALQYDFALAGYNAFVRGDYAYWSGFHHNIQKTGPEIGKYGKLNMRAGIALDRGMSAEVFVNNLTNEDDVTWIDAEGFAELRGYHMRPRTVGVNLGYSF